MKKFPVQTNWLIPHHVGIKMVEVGQLMPQPFVQLQINRQLQHIGLAVDQHALKVQLDNTRHIVNANQVVLQVQNIVGEMLVKILLMVYVATAAQNAYGVGHVMKMQLLQMPIVDVKHKQLNIPMEVNVPLIMMVNVEQIVIHAISLGLKMTQLNGTL